jgi:hypothetical protein
MTQDLCIEVIDLEATMMRVRYGRSRRCTNKERLNSRKRLLEKEI